MRVCSSKIEESRRMHISHVCSSQGPRSTQTLGQLYNIRHIASSPKFKTKVTAIHKIYGHALIIPQSRWNPCALTYQPPPQSADSGGHKSV